MPVIVNGFERNIEYRLCVRCVQDTSVPAIQFDEQGVCNYCHLHDQLCATFPNDERGKNLLGQLCRTIRRQGVGKKYDCIIGISGGRDSSFLLYCAVKLWGLRPLAVHFNDGFGNPVAGENMARETRYLGVDLRTITSDWRESRDLKIAELKASTPQLNTGTDVGIGAALYGVASQEGVKWVLYGQCFRTEGLKPLSWAYFEGDYLRDISRRFGTVGLQPWTPENPNYHLGLKELAYYVFLKGIKTAAPLYYHPYVRVEAERVMSKEFGWVYPGAHYYDDLYWSLITFIHRIKFNVDFRKNAYSALVRSGQMKRTEALAELEKPYRIEDPKVISLCIKRLGLTDVQFEKFMSLPPRHFTEYHNSYRLLCWLRPFIWVLCKLGFFPMVVFVKWFTIGPGVPVTKREMTNWKRPAHLEQFKQKAS